MKPRGQEKTKRVLVITNPMAGHCRRRRLTAVLEALRERGCDVLVQATYVRGDAERLARRARLDDVDVIAIAGGDGTINEVVNGLGADAPPIAIIPLGTTNVLAAEIDLGTDPEAAADAIAYGDPRRICLGLVNDRRFLMMASVGFDAEVVAEVKLDLKRYLGKGAYVLEALRRFPRFPSPAYALSLDGVAQEPHGIVIANGGHFAGRFLVAPDADLASPRFDVCCCMSGGRLALLRYAFSLLGGRLAGREDYRIIAAASLRIDGPKGTPVQADGDVITFLPATFTILPDAISLMTPARC